MTFEEAKKLLKKEFMVIGIHKTTEPFEFDESGWFGYEKPAVLEAFRVLAKEGYYVTISGYDYDMRKKRLLKEYEENTKSPGPGEEQPEEKKGIIYPTTFPKADFYHKHVLNESNPALKEAASQFNDALLDEQAMEIKNLTMMNGILQDKIVLLNACKKYEDKIDRSKIKRLGKEIARLNKIIHKKNMKIEEFRKESSKHLRGKIKVFYENVDLEGKLKDKDAVLSDVAEELRLSKIREKNLTEVCQKYMKENEKLKKLLADKVGNGIDWKRNADAIKLYVNRASHERLWNPINQDICNEKELSFIINHGGKRVKYALRFDGTDIVYECSDPDKKPSFFRDDSVGAVTNMKDCSPAKDTHPAVDIAEEGGDHSAIIAQCCKNIAISKDEAEIIERCTKNGTELHYSEKDGFTYTNMYGDEMPIICLRGMCQVFTDEEIKNMKK